MKKLLQRAYPSSSFSSKRFHRIFKSWSSLASVGLVGVVLALGAPKASACDACNAAFGAQLEGERADSLLAADVRKAVKNQGHLLEGSGLGSGAYKPQIPEDAPGKVKAPEVADRDTQKSDARILLAKAEAAKLADASNGSPLSSGSPAPTTAGESVVVSNQASGAPLYFGSDPNWKSIIKLKDEWKGHDFIDIIERDYDLPFPPTSFVPQDTKPDKSFTLTLNEGRAYIGNGVVYEGFLTDGTIPGPLIVVDEGDIVEVTIKNTGTIPHGASIHAAYTQTSKYLGKIQPGQEGRVVFRANTPGVYMYHCAPGGHAIPMHVIFGQYGMMVVKPKSKQYEMERVTGHKPDIEIYMIQNELYESGKQAVENTSAMYTMFNGKLFRYVEDPIKARPGDFVRIYFLNVGPNQLSTFHIVGIIWDYVYWQGNPNMVWPGGQTVTAGPSDSWVIDFRIPPDEGAYTILTHAVGSAARGAIGLIVAEKGIERPSVIRPEGEKHTPEEMDEIMKKAVRVISPYHPTSFDKPATYMPGTKHVDVQIIGNSFWPKIIEIEPGTEVTWTNEDVFTYLEGEFAGIHNAAGSDTEGEVSFATPLLAHGESGSFTFEKEGEYNYTCAPHPYMKGRVIVKKSDVDLSQLSSATGNGYLLPLAIGAFVIALVSLFRSRDTKGS